MTVTDDIAIIGMSGLFPKAPDAETFWSNILNKVDAVGDPTDDWIGDPDFFDQTATRETMRIYTKRGGFLRDLSRFDPKTFGTMPLAVIGGEPNQFLALAGAAAALDDAGLGAGSFDPGRTGIVLGHTSMPNRCNIGGYQHAVVISQTVKLIKALLPEARDEGLAELERLLHSKLPRFNVDAAPGLVPNVVAGRIANRLDLMGPNYLVDAACASSLLAIEAACTELRFGRADVMLAGGVNTSTSPLVYAVFCQLEALSRSSRIRPFDRGADGTLLGEGQGIFVLKRLKDAEAAGDRVYAVIKGVGKSSDGRAMGLMAPRLEGEVLAMKNAYRQTGIDPRTIGLLEAHGTGIPLGDRTEVQAMRLVFGERERPYPDVALGSVKSMIGHCIPAAGAAALIKICLALHHKVLPPTIVEDVNPDLELEQTRFFLNTEAAPWIHPGLHPRRAAINAFGFGGVNAHVIVEEAPGTSSAVEPTAAFGFRPADGARLFAFVGATREALISRLKAVIEGLATDPAPSLDDLSRDVLAELEKTAGAGSHRLAIVAASIGDLRKKLHQATGKLADPAVHRMQGRSGIFFADRPLGGKVAFLFPGENSQYPGMLADLAVASPLVREWFDMLEGLFVAERDVPHRVLMFPPPNGLTAEERANLERRLRQVDVGSETVFFSDLALFTLLSRLGVVPDYIVGHSTGEHAAVVASRLIVVDRDRLGAFVREMNAVYRRLAEDGAFASGTLLTVGALPRQALLEVIDGRDDVWLTMDNCPNQAIVFGPAETMDEIQKRLSAAGALCTKLPLSWAYHTPLIQPMADALRAAVIDRVDLGRPIATLYSCATGAPFPESDADIRATMASQYVKPVAFSAVIDRLYAEGARVFIEVGPNSVLTSFVRDILRNKTFLAVATDSPKAGAVSQVLQLIGQLFVAGVPIDVSAVQPRGRGAAAERRAAKAPPLPSDLPFIQLSAEEASTLRTVMGIAAGPPATVTTSDPQPAAEPTRTVGAPAAPVCPPAAPAGTGADRSSQILAGSFSLMNSFLRQQRDVTTAILRQSTPPIAHDLSTAFQLPFPAQVYLTGLDGEGEQPTNANPVPSLPHLARTILSEQEYGFWQGAIAGRHPLRQREWLLGRLAAKTAARAWLARMNREALDLRLIQILYDANSRPHIVLANGAAHGLQPPRLSVSHADGIAVAACCEQPIGIDLDGPGRVRDPQGIARIAFSEREQRLLAQRFGERATEAAALMWSVKEAAAKLSGEGLLGREQSVRVIDLTEDARTALVDHDGARIRIEVRRVREMFCCLAYRG